MIIYYININFLYMDYIIMNNNLVLVVLVLIVTLFYTYNHDKSIFLLVLLLVSASLYIQNIIDTEVKNIKNSIYYTIFDIIKKIGI